MKLSRSLSFHHQVRLLRIIFVMLLAGQGFYFLVAWIFKSNITTNSGVNNTFKYLVPVIIVLSILASRFVYRIIVRKAVTYPFIKKVESYKSAVIVGLALLEAANLISITAFLLTGDFLYVAASIIMFLLFILNVPTQDKFRTDLELTPEEITHTDL